MYDHEIEPDFAGMDRADLRSAKIAAEVYNVPVRMGWIKDGKLKSPKEFMMDSWDERDRKKKGEIDESRLLCNTVSLDQWRAWKESQKAAGRKKRGK